MRTAANNVEEANKELNEAQEHQKKSNKCLLYLIILCVIALGIILYFVITAFMGKKDPPKGFL